LFPSHRVDPHTVAFLRNAGCVYAEDEARILTEAARTADDLRSLLDRRAAGEPLEHIVGWAEFCGLRVRVRRGVFVPRRRSEFLVECALGPVRAAMARTSNRTPRAEALDLCCGSGAIGLALATLADVDVVAADNSPVAAACARENLAGVGGRVYEGDLFAPLPRVMRHGFDVILANAPYVPTGEIGRLPAEARLFEPIATLDGGPEGTSTQRRILASAADWLRAPGVVVIETEHEMSAQTARIAQDNGFATEIRESPALGATVVLATYRP
jgi:release factor glutamine methyltransferase